MYYFVSELSDYGRDPDAGLEPEDVAHLWPGLEYLSLIDFMPQGEYKPLVSGWEG